MPLDNGYCFCSIEKTKNRAHMSRKFEHNMRLREIENADPEKRSQNEILIGDPSVKDVFKDSMKEAADKNEKNKYRSYNDIARDAIKMVETESGKKVRKDAVLETEIVLTFSPKVGETDIDLNQWKEKNVQWLKDYFGEDNVVSAVLHMDETTPHIHAMITPIDYDSGKPSFNAKKWFGGKGLMSKMQTSYANAMKEFGLSRGETNSRAKHQDLQHFYTALNNVLRDELPDRSEFETEDEYRAAMHEIYDDAKLHVFALEESVKRLEEVDRTREYNDNEFRKLATETIQESQKKIASLEQDIQEVTEKYQKREQEIHGIKVKANTVDRIQLGLEELREKDPENAETFTNQLNQLVADGEKIERRNKKNKEHAQTELTEENS